MAERDLVELGGRARDRRPEERRRVARQWAEPVGERAVVAVREHAPTRVGRGLACPRLGDALVPGDRALQAKPGTHEGDPIAHRKRQAKRKELRPPAGDDAAVQLDCDELSRNLAKLDADLLRQPPGRRARPAEDVRAEVQPVGAPRLRVHAPAEAVRGLEHEDVAVAEIPRRREATDPGADDDCISNRWVTHARAPMLTGARIHSGR